MQGDPGRYHANARRLARVGPDDLPGSIGVVRSPEEPMPVGIAYGAGHVGGWRGLEWLGPIEVVWRLVIGKTELEARWALRDGTFVELGEEAI